ncbi:MAG TPA: hypothetical protein PKI11_15410 [Candidatus Hydrogenedentes bacterium]|nr:hypothetical protein [Candidatus Hydrogenedentota bacterium]HNT89101.1 hypothetical protein [Candidatus Hydrogenedentota bacterium]
MMPRIGLFLVLVLLVAGVSACAGNGKRIDASAPMDADDVASTQEDALRRLVARHIASAQRGQDDARSDLVFRRPYYFKEYSVYPNGPDDFDVRLRETESRSAPLAAEANIEKQRFATRLHRKRDQARADGNFLRDTGVETITYQWQGGQWKRVGALFVAEKTEEYVNGEWVSPREEIRRTVAEEEEKGWWGRTWGRITGIF